jgi:pSer/pThr/pTyr-binding forkhead associated (FHA) protein
MLKDLESLNGSHVNNKKVSKGSSNILQNKDTISFGKDTNKMIFYSNIG